MMPIHEAHQSAFFTAFFATYITFDLVGFRRSCHIQLHYERNVDDRTYAGFVVVLNILEDIC